MEISVYTATSIISQDFTDKKVNSKIFNLYENFVKITGVLIQAMKLFYHYFYTFL